MRAKLLLIFLVFVFWLIFSVTASAIPLGINILSVTNHIKGCAENSTHCYDQISGDSISAEVEGTFYNVSGAEAGQFYATTYVGGANNGIPTAVAESSIVFIVSSPLDLILEVFVSGADPVQMETGSKITLTNNTLNQDLLSIELWHDFIPFGEPTESILPI